MSTTTSDVAPDPLPHGGFEPAFEAAARGEPYKRCLEELLLALDDEHADRLMQFLREARGSWFTLLATQPGSLLFIGNSLSGAITPLAQAGFTLTCLERSDERARFARMRNEAHARGRVEVVVGGGAILPFADAQFDVVAIEDGLSSAPALDECRRVCAREIVLVADNRLAYKRSSGRHGEFVVPGPLEYARAALAPSHGERTLGGYRTLLARAGFDRPRTFALYPHARDFTHIVALDATTPALTIGPMERKNRLKLAARSLGLFPVLTPSFALIARRSCAQLDEPRIDRVLAAVAERIGEPRPIAEQIVATRGNTALVHTSLPGADERDPRGRWTLHIPLGSTNLPQFELHVRSLEAVRARFPSVPVPEPLLFERLDGVWLACERRLPGWTAAQIVGDTPRIARMMCAVAEHLAKLIVRPSQVFTTDDFARQVSARVELVARHAAVASTIGNLERMHARAREQLVGAQLPLVLYHADLRGKHVQVDADGDVVGILDWGTTEPDGLPYFDLLHLVVHERKQTLRCTAGDAWRALLTPERLADHERTALMLYRRTIGIDDDTARAIEELYPVLVAAMAEKNWDYSRPRWVHRQFGI